MKLIFDIAKLIAGKIANKNTNEQNEDLKHLMQDSVLYNKIYNKCVSEDFNTEQKLLYTSFNQQNAYKRFKKSKIKLNIIHLAIGTSAAAVLVVGLLLSLNINISNNKNKLADGDIVSIMLMSGEIETPNACTYSVNLPDGTNIILNGGSKLKVPVGFGLSRREVFVDGQAYFNVKKNIRMPFIVKSNKLSVEVTGTQFDIRDYKLYPIGELSLIEGSVNVELSDTSITLKPNNKISYNNVNKSIKFSEVDAKELSSWIHGVLSIRSDSFNLMIEKLKKWYGVEFIVRANVNEDILFTGDFKKDDLENALKNIALNTSLKIDYSKNTIIITNK